MLTESRITQKLSLILAAMVAAMQFAQVVSAEESSGQITAVYTWQRDSDSSYLRARHVSMAGGTEVVIHGNNMELTPENNFVRLDCTLPDGQTFKGSSLELSHENKLNSNMARGQLQYTLPSLPEVMGVEHSSALDNTVCRVDVVSFNDGGFPRFITCEKGQCEVTYTYSVTAGFIRVLPQAIFFNTRTTFVVDTQNAGEYREVGEEMPFRMGFIDQSNTNYEIWLDEDDEFADLTVVEISGQSGDAPISRASIPRLNFHVGDSWVNEDSMKTCNYMNEDCYLVRSIGVLNKLDYQTGNQNGGQILRMEGFRFIGQESNEISINGVPCEVDNTRTNKEVAFCKTGAAPEDNEADQFVGSVGLRREIFKSSSEFDLSDLESNAEIYETSSELLTSFEFPFEQGSEEVFTASRISGWFLPPHSSGTKDYIFHVTCSNSCELFLSQTNMDPSAMESIAQVAEAASKGQYYEQDREDKLSSDTLSLEAGVYHYIELRQTNGEERAFVQVSLEVVESPVTGHQNSDRAVQLLSFDAGEPVYDTIQVTVDNPTDDASFFLEFINPHTNKYYEGVSINGFPSTGDFKRGVKDFYSDVHESGINVSVEQFDSNGDITTSNSATVKIVAKMTMDTLIDTHSSNYLSAIVKRPSSDDGSFQVSVEKAATYASNNNIEYDSAFTGDFKIVIPVETDAGVAYTETESLDFSSDAFEIKQAIWNAAPQWMNKLDVKIAQISTKDKKMIYLDFFGYNGEPGDWFLEDGETGISGPSSWSSSTHYQNEYLKDYNPESIVFSPVPYEYLFTQHSKPQVVMKVDDLPVACKNIDCDYVYEEATSSVSSFSASGSSAGDILTVNGSGFSTSFVSIQYGGSNCYYDEDNSSTSQVKCTFDQDLVAGETIPQLTDNFGLAPTDSVSAVTISLAISGTETPSNQSLNPNGGTQITISGTGFPANLASLPEDFSLTFPDQSVNCNLVSVSSRQIICQPDSFGSLSNTNVDLELTVNGEVQTANFALGTSSYDATALEPQSASPVLKNDLVITLDTDITLSAEDFTVYLLNSEKPENNKELNVYEADNDAKTITARFGGAWSGTYQVAVVSSQYGRFKSSLELDVSGTITGLSPASGSIYGGTIVTLTGTNFDAEHITNNPVSIYWQNCQVLESTETSITFVTSAQTILEDDGETTRNIIVGLKTSEEAACDDEVNFCEFTFSTSRTPVLSSRSVSYNSDEEALLVTFSGSNFGTEGTTKAFFDGFEQTIISATNSKIVVRVDQINGKAVSQIQLYTYNGTPEDENQLLANLDFSDDITLIETSLSTGSQGGSVVALKVAGLGPNDSSLDLSAQSGSTGCESVSVPEYGVVLCELSENTLGSSSFSLSVDGEEVDTASNSAVSYESSLNPSVTGISSDGQDLTLTGSGFDIDSFSVAQVSLSGVEATSVSINSDSQVVATFENGVPISEGETKPVLSFSHPESSEAENASYLRLYASVSGTFSNSFSVTQSFNVDCSYAGGCALTIENTGGLTSAIQGQFAQVTVCGETCELDLESSDATSAVCTVPSVSSVYAEDNLSLNKASAIEGQAFGDDEDFLNAFDGDNQVIYSSSNDNCYVGTDFGSGKIGYLTQAAYMMNAFERDLFVDYLVLEGCNVDDDEDYSDCNSWTELYRASEEMHEGFNYITFFDSSFENRDQIPHYRLYRFSNVNEDGCEIGEITFEGIISEPETGADLSCQAVLSYGDVSEDISNAIVHYQADKTVSVTSVYPNYGSVIGGDEVTFTLSSTSSFSASDVNIEIDGIECNSVEIDGNEVSCTLGARTGLPEHSLSFFIEGHGQVAWGSNDFLYVNLWSEEATWGYELPPIQGESVYVPKGLNLLVDIASTPVLNLVLVEGSLIFPSEEEGSEAFDRTFDAHIIFINGGLFQAGTEEEAYESNLTIRLHGEKFSPLIPTFGNKVLANFEGTLDLHGKEVTHVWTELYETAEKDKLEIKVEGQVDWKAGDTIVLAPTDYSYLETEEAVIKEIVEYNSSQDYTLIKLQNKLLNKHFAEIETYSGRHGDFDMRMKGEVGLMTRTVRFIGAIETPEEDEHGAHILSHCDGHDCLTTRISFVELAYVGQAFLLGRYPIHFHRIGDVHNSYVKGNSIHHSFNRAVTVHATNYLRVENNLVYDIMGHAIFIEDGVEENNLFENNLVLKVKRSWSLLTTDQMPAAFFITNPNNIFQSNRVAGSERFGFWFDLKPTSQGPNMDEAICPVGKPLGRFDSNHVHSNGMYGLRIFENFTPKKYPCREIEYDLEAETDEEFYQGNTPVCVSFTNLNGWKNARTCTVAKGLSCVSLVDFTCVDNPKANIAISMTKDAKWRENAFLENNPKVIGGALIGYSRGNSASAPVDAEFGSEDPRDARGIILPKADYFSIEEVSFFNYNNDYDGEESKMAALFTCADCPKGDNPKGGIIHHTKDLYFHDDVTKRVKFNWPYQDILVDTDGTLTDEEPFTSVVYHNNHFNIDECNWNLGDAGMEASYLKFGGITCTPEVQVRGVIFQYQAPDRLFKGADIKIFTWDEEKIAAMTEEEREEYETNDENWTVVPFFEFTLVQGWQIPLATGHRYKVSWGALGLDFESIQVELRSSWLSTDMPIGLAHNFTDVRVAINVEINDEFVEANTLDPTAQIADLEGNGLNYLETETDNMFYTLIDGRDKTKLVANYEAARCIGECVDETDDSDVSAEESLWSNEAWWESEGYTLPQDGEDVFIPSTWNLLYDCGVDQTLQYKTIYVQGRLSFDPEADCDSLELQTHNVFISGGEFLIQGRNDDEGVPTEYPIPAQVTLLGGKEDNYLTSNPEVDTGNKAIVVGGKASMYGKERSLYMTRLTKEVIPGDDYICVGEIGDWEAGDELGLTPTRQDHLERDYAIITSIEEQSGENDCLFKVSFDDGDDETEDRLSYYHFGSTRTDWSEQEDIDMRGEVFLLSRSIKIIGEDVETWGGQIVVVDYREEGGARQSGWVDLNNIQVYNCSQMDTSKAAIRFEYNSMHGVSSYIRKSAFTFGNGRAVHISNSERIELHDNIFFSFSTIGISLNFAYHVILKNNVVADIWARDWDFQDLIDSKSAYMLTASKASASGAPKNVTLTGNGAIGATYAGFTAPGSQCGENPDDEVMLEGNYAHSIRGYGWVANRNKEYKKQLECMQVRNFKGWKVRNAAVGVLANAYKIVMTNMVAIDAGSGLLVAHRGEDGSDFETYITDSHIQAESTLARDCPSRNWCNTINRHREKFDWEMPEHPGDYPEGYTTQALRNSLCIDKYGTIIPSYATDPNDVILVTARDPPVENIFGDSAWSASAYYENVVFKGFNDENTYCGGGKLKAVTFNEKAADMIPMVRFNEVTFEDSSDNGLAWMFEPPEHWITVRSCGSFPCTGPLNTALIFFRTKFVGERGTADQKNFQIIPGNDAIAHQNDNCEWMHQWNGYYCTEQNFGVLTFENGDDDRSKRNIYPVYVTPITDAYGLEMDHSLSNKLNQFMEHTCNGIYPGLFRKGRFNALVRMDKFYNIEYSGSVPKNTHYKLHGNSEGIRVQVKYDYKNTFAVVINEEIVPELEFDNDLKAVPALTGGYCGENKWEPLANLIQFTITAGCQLTVQPKNVVRATIRIQWTLNEFFASGGTTNFVDRLAGSLGIHASTIKVVSVYEGSVVIVFQILEESDDGDEENDLSEIEDKLEQQIGEQTLDIGVKVISGSISDVEIDPDFWQMEEEEQVVIISEEETEGGERGEEILVKKKETDNSGQQMAAIIIISSAIVITLTLLIAAYMVLKNKFEKQHEKEIAQADGVSSEGSQNISGAEDDLQKQYVPQLMDDSERKMKAKKENQDDIVVENEAGAETSQYSQVANDAAK